MNASIRPVTSLSPVPVSPLAPLAATAAAVLLLAHGGAHALTKTYTLDADFAQGTLENLNYTAVANQLQVNVVGVGSRYIFIANHGEDSVSKFDTTNVLNASGVIIAPGREVARYKTFAGQPGVSNGGNPSRLAIDVDGNAYVLNRMPNLNAPPYLMKILVDGAIDRNRNGVIDSSQESNGTAGIQAAEMFPLNANDDAGIVDERVAWIKPVGTDTSFGRSVCIAPDGKLWVGIWNQARYYRVDPATGSTLGIGPSNLPYVTLTYGGVTWNPYGCTVDKNGILWSATLGSGRGGLGRVDTATGAVSQLTSPYHAYNYGIAQGNGKIYQAPYQGNYGWAAYNTATGTWSRSPHSYNGAGIAVDGEGNVLSTDYSGIRKYKADGTLLWSRTEGGTTYGVMVDGNNDVWVMNTGTYRTTKYRGSDGALIGYLPTGSYPYVYTDGSGLTTKNQTVNKLGTWTTVLDGQSAGRRWGKLSWNANVPAGAVVEVFARASDNLAALDLQAFMPVANNASINTGGRYVQLRARLQMNAANQTPQLLDLTVNTNDLACDIDGDADVDSVDVDAVRAAIGQPPAAGERRDVNGDGAITINDVRACTVQCTRANCATQ